MMNTSLAQWVTLPSLQKLPEDLEKLFRQSQNEQFTLFFRTALLFGMSVYVLIIAWDWITGSVIFSKVLPLRISMIGIFIIALALSFLKRFPPVSRYVGMVFILILMANVIWVQTVIEENLEEGYGMLITPGASLSVIVFSGAEMGYGALLTPLLLLPIGFTGIQAGIVSALVMIAMNVGMNQTELPSAFVETANSIFVSIGIFTTILAFLVNQQRRAAFKLEHDLRDANASKSRFLAMMSHEVRTPLNGMLGMATLLFDTTLSDKQYDISRQIKYSGETLLAMLNDILDFSKMEAGKFEIEKMTIDLVPLIQSVADLMRSRATEQGIGIKTDIADNVPLFIYSDPTRLRQAFLNLLSNAIKFTEEGHVGIVITNIGEKDDEVLLRCEIVDTGSGMSEEVMNKLFREYTQADESTSRTHGGTGLGLSICKQIVELLGGEIKVKSTVGEGSTFWFDIPVLPMQPVRESDTTAQEVVPDLVPMAILLVEDNQIIANYTESLLTAGSHKVTVADCGQAALDCIKHDVYDVVLLDYNLPDMPGKDVAIDIRSNDDVAQDIPIIALTAHSDQSIIDRCLAAGMTDYLLKPVSRASLFVMLAKYGAVQVSGAASPIDESNMTPTTTHTIFVNEKIDGLVNELGFDIAKDIVEEYLKGLIDKEQLLQDAITQGDEDGIVQHAHDMVSMSGAIGMTESYKLFDEIQKMRSTPIDLDEVHKKALASYQKEREYIQAGIDVTIA